MSPTLISRSTSGVSDESSPEEDPECANACGEQHRQGDSDAALVWRVRGVELFCRCLQREVRDSLRCRRRRHNAYDDEYRAAQCEQQGRKMKKVYPRYPRPYRPARQPGLCKLQNETCKSDHETGP